MFKTIYDHPITDLTNARIVSHAECCRLRALAIEQDKIRIKYNLQPILKQEETNSYENHI